MMKVNGKSISEAMKEFETNEASNKWLKPKGDEHAFVSGNKLLGTVEKFKSVFQVRNGDKRVHWNGSDYETLKQAKLALEKSVETGKFDIVGIRESIDEAYPWEKQKFQLEVNQIFHDANAKSVRQSLKKILTYTNNHGTAKEHYKLVDDFLKMIEDNGIKKGDSVRLVIEK